MNIAINTRKAILTIGIVAGLTTASAVIQRGGETARASEPVPTVSAVSEMQVFATGHAADMPGAWSALREANEVAPDTLGVGVLANDDAGRLLVTTTHAAVYAISTDTGQACRRITYPGGESSSGCVPSFRTGSAVDVSMVRLAPGSPMVVSGLLPDSVSAVNVRDSDGNVTAATVGANAYSWIATDSAVRPVSVEAVSKSGSTSSVDLPDSWHPVD